MLDPALLGVRGADGSAAVTHRQEDRGSLAPSSVPRPAEVSLQYSFLQVMRAAAL